MRSISTTPQWPEGGGAARGAAAARPTATLSSFVAREHESAFMNSVDLSFKPRPNAAHCAGGAVVVLDGRARGGLGVQPQQRADVAGRRRPAGRLAAGADCARRHAAARLPVQPQGRRQYGPLPPCISIVLGLLAAPASMQLLGCLSDPNDSTPRSAWTRNAFGPHASQCKQGLRISCLAACPGPKDGIEVARSGEDVSVSGSLRPVARSCSAPCPTRSSSAPRVAWQMAFMVHFEHRMVLCFRSGPAPNYAGDHNCTGCAGPAQNTPRANTGEALMPCPDPHPDRVHLLQTWMWWASWPGRRRAWRRTAAC